MKLSSMTPILRMFSDAKHGYLQMPAPSVLPNDMATIVQGGHSESKPLMSVRCLESLWRITLGMQDRAFGAAFRFLTFVARSRTCP